MARTLQSMRTDNYVMNHQREEFYGIFLNSFFTKRAMDRVDFYLFFLFNLFRFVCIVGKTSKVDSACYSGNWIDVGRRRCKYVVMMSTTMCVVIKSIIISVTLQHSCGAVVRRVDAVGVESQPRQRTDVRTTVQRGTAVAPLHPHCCE